MNSLESVWWPLFYVLALIVLASLVYDLVDYLRWTLSNWQKRLEGKKVLITGGSQGIGLAIIQELVSIQDIEIHSIDILSPGPPFPSQVHHHQGDITDHPSMETILRQIGPVDILINNAGIFQKGKVQDKSIGQIEKTFQVNLLSPIRLAKAAMKGMQREGCMVVDVCSLTKDLPGIAMADYCASKAGLYMYHQVLRQELKSSGSPIHTLIVSPYVLKGGLFEGFHMPLLSTLLPALTHSQVATHVVMAMALHRHEIVIPRYFHGITLLTRLVPVSLWDALAQLFLSNAFPSKRE